MTDLLADLQLVWTVLGQALGLDPALGEVVAADPPLGPAIGVALLAAVSSLIAHSSVLYLNHVRGVRAAISATVGLAYLMTLHLVEALIIWGVATAATGTDPTLRAVVCATLLASAPQVFNVFTFVPHVGLYLGRMLEVWSFLVFFVLVGHITGAPAWLGALITSSGWLVMQVLSRVLSAPLTWLGSHVWSLASGRPVLLTSRDILAGAPFIPIGAADPR